MKAKFDPLNRAHIVALIERAQAKFSLAAKAWEHANNSAGDAQQEKFWDQRCTRLQKAGEKLLSPLGIACHYPGLYPCFTVRGHEEFSVEMAVLAACNLPRNWLKNPPAPAPEPGKPAFDSLNFDGRGINDVDAFRSRVATFQSFAMAEKYGKLFAASLALLTEAKKLREQVRAHNSQQTAMGQMIIWGLELDKAITSAEGEK